MLSRLVSAVAAAALLTATPAFAGELATSSPEPRAVPACCEGVARQARDHAEREGEQIRQERSRNDEQASRPDRVNDPFSPHPYWNAP